MLTANPLFETTKDVMVNLQGKTHVLIQATGEAPIQVLAHNQGQVIPVYTSTLFRKTFNLEGFEALQLKSSKTFGYHIGIKQRQEVEPTDNEAPPPVTESGNVLKRMRDKVRSELGITREAFLTRDIDLPGYEFDDEEDVMFEEDEIALAKQQKKEKQDAEKAAAAAATADDNQLRSSDGNTAPNVEGNDDDGN